MIGDLGNALIWKSHPILIKSNILGTLVVILRICIIQTDIVNVRWTRLAGCSEVSFSGHRLTVDGGFDGDAIACLVNGFSNLALLGPYNGVRLTNWRKQMPSENADMCQRRFRVIIHCYCAEKLFNPRHPQFGINGLEAPFGQYLHVQYWTASSAISTQIFRALPSAAFPPFVLM